MVCKLTSDQPSQRKVIRSWAGGRKKVAELDHPLRGGVADELHNLLFLLVSSYELRERERGAGLSGPNLSQTGEDTMSKTMSFEVLVIDGRSSNWGNLFWRTAKRSNFKKHRANGNPIRVVHTDENGKRTGKVLFNQEHLKSFGVTAEQAAVS